MRQAFRTSSHITSALIIGFLIGVGALWFGLKLGPLGAPRPSTQESAVIAAQEFVRKAVLQRGGHNGPLKADVTFPKMGKWPGTAQDSSDPDHWTVTGLAYVDRTQVSWTVDEKWDGFRNWRLKVITVTGPKQGIQP